MGKLTCSKRGIRFMDNAANIGRRNFLKLTGTSLAAFPVNFLSIYKPDGHSTEIPSIGWADIPFVVQDIIRKIPALEIQPDGLLWIWDQNRQEYFQSRLIPTQWNLERNTSYERLFSDKSWGIVLHWFGTTFSGEQSLAGYMRGFDSLRHVRDYETKTSAHFLVGDNPLVSLDTHDSKQLAIIQTQLPDRDGTPLVASHLSGLDYLAHEHRQQYFVRAFYELGYQDPSIHSILTELYDGPRLDPNYRTIAIEMAGADFEQESHFPSTQQLANVLGLLIALMRRYRIPALNILGHQEIELRKPDPGKKFMALIRYLVGVYALFSRDHELFNLVFGGFIMEDQDAWMGVMRYFRFVRDYFTLVGYPQQVYQWEVAVNFGNFMKRLSAEKLVGEDKLQPFVQFLNPIPLQTAAKKDCFLSPPGHEGVDLYLADNREPYNSSRKVNVRLPAQGQCLMSEAGSGCGFGKFAIFRHLQNDGAEIITVFSNLETTANLEPGRIYDAGYSIGSIAAGGPLGEGFLHFAIAYGATWDTNLKQQSIHPVGASSDWIRKRYLDPIEYLKTLAQERTDHTGDIHPVD
jgi:hypothetical protein